MRLKVLFFGVLRDRFSLQEELQQFPGSTVAELLQYYRVIAPELGELWLSVAVAVNQQYVAGSTALSDGDEVALLPPVSGGTGVHHVALTTEVIDSVAITAALKSGADGAITVFDGIVRDNTRGRRTLYLDYTAYEPMALEQMRKLADEAAVRFAVRAVAVVHRLGQLQVGQTSVLIAVASAHRGAGFEACRWLIDTLKKQVPIYKREVFVDGAEWAAGEPFPAEVMGAS